MTNILENEMNIQTLCNAWHLNGILKSFQKTLTEKKFKKLGKQVLFLKY